VDWNQNPNPVIGDWGFDRPGYPKGLYIQGVTVKEEEPVTNPLIYDNDVFDDVFDDEWVMAMASLGNMNLVGLIVTPVLTDGWGFYKPEWIETARDARRLAAESGMDMSRIPEIVIGTEAKSEKEGEKKDSAGARLYVQLINDHYRRDPAHPLLVSIGDRGRPWLRRGVSIRQSPKSASCTIPIFGFTMVTTVGPRKSLRSIFGWSVGGMITGGYPSRARTSGGFCPDPITPRRKTTMLAVANGNF
jgi:hypothetical protein